MRGCPPRLRDRAHVRRLCTSDNKGQPFVLVRSTKYFVLSSSTGALFDSTEALGSPEARGSILDRLCCVLVIPLRDLVEFVEKYGIALCYDPQLPSSEQTALDAPDGYISLYLSLFSIGNLRFPLDAFCLDVYGGVPTLPLFRSLLTIGPAVPAGDWLTFQKRSGPGIPQIFDNSMTNIPNWKSEFIFVKETLISDARPALITDFRHGLSTFAYPYTTEPFDEVLRSRLGRYTFEAQTFLEPILYLAGIASTWEHATNIPSILVDEEEISFQNFMKKPGQTSTFSVRPAGESSSVSKNKDVSSFELLVVGDGPLEQDVGISEG
ncbi:hypothetical protein Tco_1139241, partial [Tanacetum coccineum]